MASDQALRRLIEDLQEIIEREERVLLVIPLAKRDEPSYREGYRDALVWTIGGIEEALEGQDED